LSALYLFPAFLLGLGIGGYIERYRWLSWAKRKHPDEVDVGLF
jgi:hypothetical protein